MIEIKRLPKEPVEALDATLAQLLSMTHSKSVTVDHLKKRNHPLVDEIIVISSISRKIAQRLPEAELRDLVIRNLQFSDSDTLEKINERAEIALGSLHAFQIEKHFLDEELVKEFDQAHVPACERDEIRTLLERAKTMAASADFLDGKDSVRRSFIHKINLAENELFKEAVGVQAFFAVAYEASRFIKKFGENAKPLAEAIELARTKTERHVEGYPKLEAEQKPKQLPKPEAES